VINAEARSDRGCPDSDSYQEIALLIRALARPGRMLYAVAMACFGSHYLTFMVTGSSAPPGPPWYPEQTWLSWAAGASLLGAALAMLFEGRVRWVALMLGTGLFLRVAIVHIPPIAVSVPTPEAWTSAADVMSLAGGAFCIATTLADIPDIPPRLAQWIFAVPLFVVGAQHFVYAHFIADFIPDWIPGHLFWAYFLGMAFFASALAIICRVSAVPASALLGLIFLLCVLILHLPRVLAAQHNGNEWTSMFVALGMAGSSWAVTGSLGKRN
jgi:uncharacterized membrane protein